MATQIEAIRQRVNDEVVRTERLRRQARERYESGKWPGDKYIIMDNHYDSKLEAYREVLDMLG